jgi:elongation of very long chain fatty acids protein 4
VLFGILAYALILALLYPVGKILGKQKYSMIGVAHNAFLFFLSLYMCTAIFVTTRAGRFSLWNNPVGNTTNDWRLAKLMWLFYISKLPEFGDTFLMMLKQNYHQVTFLHLYHHSTIFVIWLFVVGLAPGGDAYWSAMLNSGVHVVMYGYYFGTSVFSDGPVRSFLNKTKFMITKGQMTQFGFNCFQCVYDLFVVENCVYRTDLIWMLFAYMISLLTLFGNFLLQGQRKAKQQHKLAKKKH